MQNQPAKKKYPTLTTLETYRRQLSEHRWIIPFNENSYAALFEQQKQEHFLWMTAFRGGIAYVNAFYQSKQQAVNILQRSICKEYHDAAKEKYKQLIEKGEFDQFRQEVNRHDWYHFMSDDNGVWRRGRQSEQKLLDIVKAKGGLYQTYFEKVKKEQGL